jgi:hypothetical protein
MVRARTLARVLSVVAMALMWPSGASAESDMISWLDSLSGPGPFYARIPGISGQDFKIICAATSDKKIHPLFARQFDGGGAKLPCLTNSNEIKWYLSVHFNFLTTFDQNQFNEATKRSVNAKVLEAVWRWRFHPSLDAGVAVGWTGFTDGRDQTNTFPMVNRFTVTPVSIMLRPGEWFADNRWTRAVGLRFNEAILFSDISSVDFGGALGAFSRGTEANARFAVTFDYFVASIH